MKKMFARISVCFGLMLVLCSHVYTKVGSHQVFTSIYDDFFIALDTLNSTYRYFLKISSDSEDLIGREISHGSFENSDTCLRIFSPDSVAPYITLLSSARHAAGDSTEIYVSAPDINFIKKIVLYGSGAMDSKGYVPSELEKNYADTLFPDGSLTKVPMAVRALKIVYANGPGPLIELSDIGRRRKHIKRGNAMIAAYSKEFEFIMIEHRGFPPRTSTYYWAGTDTLTWRGHADIGGQPIEFVALIREKRRVISRTE